MARRTLESELARLITVAEEHKSNGLEPGHQYFKRLQMQASKTISDYTDVCGGTRDDVAVQVPKLRELDNLADGVATPKIPMYIVSAFFVGLISVLLLAGYHDLYHWLTTGHWLTK
jgi:hypothetical protein